MPMCVGMYEWSLAHGMGSMNMNCCESFSTSSTGTIVIASCFFNTCALKTREPLTSL